MTVCFLQSAAAGWVALAMVAWGSLAWYAPSTLFLLSVALVALPMTHIEGLSEVRVASLGATTLQNLAIALGILPFALRRGLRRWWNPLLLALLLLLLMTFTVSSRLPWMAPIQPFKTLAVLGLPLVAFEIKKGEAVARRTFLLVCLLPTLCVVFGLCLQLAGVRDAYEIYYGAFRLRGATIPAQLAQLAIVGLIASLFRSRSVDRYLGLALVNFGWIVWTGTRLAMVQGLIIVGSFLVWRGFRHYFGRQRFWQPQIAMLLLVVPALFGSYLPNLAYRLDPDTPFVPESIVVTIGGDEPGEGVDLSIVEGQGARPKAENGQPAPEGKKPAGVRLPTAGRLNAWRHFWSVASVNPWFGRGLGAGVSANRGELHPTFRAPHNAYLRTVVDGGFVGLAVVLVALLTIFWQLLKSSRGAARTAVLAAAFVLFFDAFLRNTWITMSFTLPFWLLLSCLVHEGVVDEEAAVPDDDADAGGSSAPARWSRQAAGRPG